MVILFSYDVDAEDECNFDPPAYYSSEYIEKYREEDFYPVVETLDVEDEMVTVTLPEVESEPVEPNQSDIELLACVYTERVGLIFVVIQ